MFGLRVPVAVVIVGCGMAWKSAAVSGSAAFVTDGRGECVAVCLTTARCDERIDDSVDDRGELGDMWSSRIPVPPANAPASFETTSTPIFTAPPRMLVVVTVVAASTLAIAAVLAAFAAMLPMAGEDDDVDVMAASVAAWRMMGDSSLIVCRMRVAAI